MSQQLGHYLRKKALISSLPPHLLVQLRVAAWETPGWSDTGKAWAAHPWSECRSDPQLGARFYLLGWFRLLCFFVVHITLEGHSECVICCWIIAEAYESEGWRAYAKGKATAPYITSGSREKEDTRCQTSVPCLSTFAKGAMRTQVGRRKIRPTDEILAFLK